MIPQLVTMATNPTITGSVGNSGNPISNVPSFTSENLYTGTYEVRYSVPFSTTLVVVATAR